MAQHVDMIGCEEGGRGHKEEDLKCQEKRRPGKEEDPTLSGKPEVSQGNRRFPNTWSYPSQGTGVIPTLWSLVLVGEWARESQDKIVQWSGMTMVSGSQEVWKPLNLE